MNRLGMCIRKEYIETKRRYKLYAFFGVPILLGFMVLASLILLPSLIETLPSEMFTTSGGSEGVAELMQSMLPNNVSGSIAMYAADMGMFYIITVIAITSGVVTKEIKKKQWILPMCAGIKPKNMLLAKYIVYGCLSMLATFLGYTVYYIVSLCFFAKDMSVIQFLICGGIFSLAVLWISVLSIALSVISKKQWIAASSMIATALLTPDILYLFRFGRFLPTFMLTYVYNSGLISDRSSLIVSILIAIIMMIGMIIGSLKSIEKIK